MNRLITAVTKLVKGLSGAVLRFPLTVFCLACATALTCYMISLYASPDLIIQKWMFVFMFGSFLGIAAQVACERFPRLARWGLVVYLVSILVIVGYYLIILPAPAIDYGVGARASVAMFAMFCAFIWLPSYDGKYDFNSVALVHFKSALTAILYAAVLSAGLSAIIGAVDILLFELNNDVYGYMMAIVWIMFATIYYLSLLPKFNSETEEDQADAREKSLYPRMLEILISYIAIPLVAAYTLVLIAYFVKIGITRVWPTGQLGPMILGYSAAGLLIYILASRLDNRFAKAYQLGFPKILVPVVAMQLVSVYIRLNAYGVTESRYYLALFGVFTLVIGLVLSFRPVKKNGIIAVLAGLFALFSVIPPVDAFTVSRNSQVNRLENMLQQYGVLADNKIQPITNADLNLRLETTSILDYLDRRRYSESIAWLPEDFQTYRDMKKTFGFEPAYKYLGDENYFYAGLDMQTPLNIGGFDTLVRADAYPGMEPTSYELGIRGRTYQLLLKDVSPLDKQVSVRDDQGKVLAQTGLYDFAETIADSSDAVKELRSVEEMTLDVPGEGCRLRIVFQNINITYGSGSDNGGNYSMLILIAVTSQP